LVETKIEEDAKGKRRNNLVIVRRKCLADGPMNVHSAVADDDDDEVVHWRRQWRRIVVAVVVPHPFVGPWEILLMRKNWRRPNVGQNEEEGKKEGNCPLWRSPFFFLSLGTGDGGEWLK
jgi:hypothetical protein